MARGELPDLTPERCEYAETDALGITLRCVEEATGRNTETEHGTRRYCQAHEDEDEREQERAREVAGDPHMREGFTE
jgi:hypothetical protein